MAFDALDVTLELLRAMRPTLARIRTRNRSLHEQMKRAGASIALNLAEGRRRSGADRRYLFEVAAGSAAEVRTALQVGEALGDIDSSTLEQTRQLLDRVIAMLWRLTH